MSDQFADQSPSQVNCVTSVERLRERREFPSAALMVIETQPLDCYRREFMPVSPLVIIETAGDVLSMGDEPGFIRIVDNSSLFIPDRAGNNRLDTLVNILGNPVIRLLLPSGNSCVAIQRMGSP